MGRPTAQWYGHFIVSGWSGDAERVWSGRLGVRTDLKESAGGYIVVKGYGWSEKPVYALYG